MLRKIALLSGVVLLAACSNGSFTLSSEPTQFLTRGLNDAKNGVLLAADGHIAIRICMNIGGDSNEYWSCRDHQLSLPTGKLEHAKKTHYLASSSEASKATGIPDVKEAITGFRIETSGGSFEFESKRLIGFKDFETEGGKATNL